MSFQVLTETEQKAVRRAGMQLTKVGELLADNPTHENLEVVRGLTIELCFNTVLSVARKYVHTLTPADAQALEEKLDELLQTIPASIPPV